MSFYTSLTGLNAATSQLAVTSNNIANVGTTGFKRSRADFGDIFATSPLQKASSVIGQGVALKQVSQEFSQGNIAFSANSLDIAITGDGFFPLKSADGLQDIFTRNGTFLLNDSYNVVNSAGQALIAAAVDSSGKADLDNLSKLLIPRKTSGDAVATSQIQLGLNFPADAQVPVLPFDRNDATTYNKTTAVTVYDAGGNGYLATVYYRKTQVATPADAVNKWQTYVYIGDTKLQEKLIQSTDKNSENQYVNKYGEIRAESDIPPQDIARGVTKLFNLDDLKNPLSSSAASAATEAMPLALTNEWKNSIAFPAKVTALVAGGAIAADGIKFKLNVDGSSDDITVDLSYLSALSPEKSFTGVEIAREMTNVINKAYGDQRYFDFSSLTTVALPAKADLFKISVDGGADKTITLTSPDADGASLKTLTIEESVAQIQTQMDLAYPPLPAGKIITVGYDPVKQSFTFKPNGEQVITMKSASNVKNELFNLPTAAVTVDAANGTYGATILPNGAAMLDPADQRYGVAVTFDEANNNFIVSSGTTGDTSSIKISGASSLANQLFGYQTSIDGVKTPTSSTPLRGIESQAATLSGNAIGINLDNKFRVDASNNQFVVTVDNVTGLIEMPPKGDYNIEEFRDELEKRINSLADSFGRTVNGVKVEIVDIVGTNNKQFKFTTGTTGDNSFLKVSANSIWGLANVESARGSTSRWLEPPQAKNSDGFPLYVDRDGLETSDPGTFSEDETRELWSPIFLDKGELTFDTGGNLKSPVTATEFKSTTIGNSGATLQFSIDYGASTQFSSPFSVLKQDQNGRPEGDLIGVDIADDGLVSASYSNGSQKSLAKIVLVNFASPTGLRQIGDSSYYATSKSGDAKYGEAGAAGFGTVRAGARERANVDLTTELVELITAQRNFQANAKAIETNNTLTQAIINIRS